MMSAPTNKLENTPIKIFWYVFAGAKDNAINSKENKIDPDQFALSYCLFFPKILRVLMNR